MHCCRRWTRPKPPTATRLACRVYGLFSKSLAPLGYRLHYGTPYLRFPEWGHNFGNHPHRHHLMAEATTTTPTKTTTTIAAAAAGASATSAAATPVTVYNHGVLYEACIIASTFPL